MQVTYSCRSIDGDVTAVSRLLQAFISEFLCTWHSPNSTSQWTPLRQGTAQSEWFTHTHYKHAVRSKAIGQPQVWAADTMWTDSCEAPCGSSWSCRSTAALAAQCEQRLRNEGTCFPLINTDSKHKRLRIDVQLCLVFVGITKNIPYRSPSVYQTLIRIKQSILSCHWNTSNQEQKSSVGLLL